MGVTSSTSQGDIREYGEENDCRGEMGKGPLTSESCRGLPNFIAKSFDVMVKVKQDGCNLEVDITQHCKSGVILRFASDVSYEHDREDRAKPYVSADWRNLSR